MYRDFYTYEFSYTGGLAFSVILDFYVLCLCMYKYTYNIFSCMSVCIPKCAPYVFPGVEYIRSHMYIFICIRPENHDTFQL